MSNATKDSKAPKMKLTSPEARASFPQVFEPKAVNGGEPMYSVQLLFQTKETETSKKLGLKVVDITPLKQAVADVLTAEFGADRTKWPQKLELPFRDGKEKDYDGYGDGVTFINVKSKMKPGIVYPWAGADGRPEPLTVQSDLYGGCIIRATLNPYYWEYMGKKGVSFGLQNIQKVRDCEMFGGRVAPEKDFDALEAPKPAAAPAAGGAQAGAPADPLAGLP